MKMTNPFFGSDEEEKTDSGIVYRDGKPFKKVNPKDAEWLKNSF